MMKQLDEKGNIGFVISRQFIIGHPHSPPPKAYRAGGDDRVRKKVHLRSPGYSRIKYLCTSSFPTGLVDTCQGRRSVARTRYWC